ncbi:MAG: ABC transporter permease [Fimbriimonas sp.]|nr:ABC transporter permease [Fimbriimonas sp.]
MLSELKELWKFRELLLTMVQREIKIRYKNSALGFLWSMLNPLITVLVMSFIFQNFLGNDQVHSATAYILAAYLPFTFFQLCLMDSAQTILIAMPLIKKIYLPREILPIASVISNFIHLLMALLMFFLFMTVVYLVHPGVWPFQWTSIYLPLLLLINLALSLGLSFYISAFNTFYEDIKYLVGVLTYLMFFMCPILYFEERVANSTLNIQWGGRLYMLMNLNPVFALSNAYRKLLIAPIKVPVNGQMVDPLPLDWRYVWWAAFVSVVILVTGYSTFNKLKWRFVERP